MKSMQEFLLEFLENEKEKEEDKVFGNLINYLDNQKISRDRCNLKCFLRLILNVTNDHNQPFVFMKKIGRIFKSIHGSITQFFSNWDIFEIFKSNKRIILLLFDEKILLPDKQIYYVIINDTYKTNFYPEYFFIEFESYFNDKLKKEIISNISEDNDINYQIYSEKRQKGINDNYICELIQNDAVENFISYVNRRNISLTSTIPDSIYETNSMLLNSETLPTLIEYAAFYGSIQIIQFLKNFVEPTTSLMKYAIHSNNAELIHLVEELLDNGAYKDNLLIECYIESIKCHHINIMNYFKNFIDKPLNYNEIILQDIVSYNFIDIHDLINKNLIKMQELLILDFSYRLFYIKYFFIYDWIPVVDFYIKNLEEIKKMHQYWISLLLFIKKIMFLLIMIFI